MTEIAVENPSCTAMPRRGSDTTQSSAERQPWQFGHGETKRTCLWNEKLPLLHPQTLSL